MPSARENLPSNGTRPGMPKRRTQSGDVAERGIAAKEFVAAQSRNRNFEAKLMSGLGDKPAIDPVD